LQTSSAESRKGDAGLIVGIVIAAVFAALAIILVAAFVVHRRGNSSVFVNTGSTSGNPFPKRRRRRAGYGGTGNLQPPSRNQSSPANASISSSSDPIATGLALAPDDEPDGDGIMNDIDYHDHQPYSDDPVLVEVNPLDEEGNQLDNVDFV
jgi:hypothetical protein